MAKVTRQKRLAEDEEPEGHIAAEGKRILKEMVAKQMNTALSIDSQQKRERTFIPGAPLDDGSGPSGTVPVSTFSALREQEEIRSKLLGAGVPAEDVDKLFLKDKSRLSGPERFARQQLWEEAAEKLLEADSRVASQEQARLDKELRDCVPATGIYAQLLLAGRKQLPATNARTADGLSETELQKTEKELFGHLGTTVPPATCRKRRRDRKIVDLLDSEVSNPPQTSKLPGSLWDVKTAPINKTKSGTVPPTRITPHPVAQKREKIIGCTKQRMFTIRDGAIVELKGNQVCQSDRVDIASSVTEKTKMTIEEIKSISKFANYEPGLPNKILFVKNFPPQLSESELLKIFAEFSPIECRVMTGKMKGQGFVTFPDVEIAQRALDGVLGRIIGQKPLIVQFGRSQPSDKTASG